MQGHPFAAVKAYPQRADRARDLDPRQLRLRRAGRGASSACPTATPGSSATAKAASGRSISTSAPIGRARAIRRRRRPLRLGAGRAAPWRRRSTTSPRACSPASTATAASWARWLSPDDAAKVLQSADQERIAKIRRDSFAGTGPEVMARIVELKERVGVDEMAVVTWTHDEAVRRTKLHRARKSVLIHRTGTSRSAHQFMSGPGGPRSNDSILPKTTLVRSNSPKRPGRRC